MTIFICEKLKVIFLKNKVIMNIGILTFHNAINYGAVLQCYALCEYLRLEGNNVYVLNYSNEELLSCYKVFNWHRFVHRGNVIDVVHRFFYELSLLKARKERSDKFNQFVNTKLNLINLDSADLSTLDLVIIGSDQVWNTKLTHGFNDYYWGHFLRSDKTRLISYAASIGEYWARSQDVVAKSLLAKFDDVSVRELDAKIRLSSLLPNKKIALSVDPTLLINKQSWSKLSISPKVREPYLLVYQVRKSDITIRIADEISKRLSLKVIYLSADVAGKNSNCCRGASPQDFLGLFENASFVVCSSFHGTVFSLIFEKPFISVRLNDGKDNRVESLLSRFNAQHRFLSSEKEIESLSNLVEIIEYNPSVFESSRNYLQRNICE